MKYQKKTHGRFEVIQTTSDRTRYASTTSYTPARLKTIFDAANSGDIEQLCLCGREILERNWDVIAAMEQRTDALCGCKWEVRPGDGTPEAAEAAKAFDAALTKAARLNELATFYDFCAHCMDAAVMPFSPSAIVWGEGGTLDGFQTLDAWNFTLREGFVPRLMTEEYPAGLPEEEQKYRFVFHQFRKKSDPVRQGKIRVLAWLHCFQNWPIKDLFSFIERFGMPFVVAKVDQNAWENERQALHSMIRSFGPNGGGVFTRETEVQLLNAANTGGDNVYFRALEFTRAAIYTLIVGQLASSSDSSGMSNGDAQTAVRQDILEADARAIEATVYAQIAAPWTLFQFGDHVAVPELHFQVEPPEDEKAAAEKKLLNAQVVQTLASAGYKADAATVSKIFGLPLTYEPVTQQAGMNGFAMSAEDKKKDKTSELAEALTEWLEPLAEELSGLSNGTELPDNEFGKRLAACAEGKKNGSTDKLERFQENEIYEGLARGMTQ